MYVKTEEEEAVCSAWDYRLAAVAVLNTFEKAACKRRVDAPDVGGRS